MKVSIRAYRISPTLLDFRQIHWCKKIPAWRRNYVKGEPIKIIIIFNFLIWYSPHKSTYSIIWKLNDWVACSPQIRLWSKWTKFYCFQGKFNSNFSYVILHIDAKILLFLNAKQLNPSFPLIYLKVDFRLCGLFWWQNFFNFL